MSDNPTTPHPDLSQPPAANPPQRYGPDGKYESIEAWTAATRASEQEGSRLARELREKTERLQQLEQAVLGQQRQPADPFNELAEIGIPIDAFNRAVDARAQQQLLAQLGPVSEMYNARAKIVADYPDYAAHEPKILAYVNSDPQLAQDYAAMSRVNAYRAMEWAIGVYSRQGGPTTDNPTNGALPGNSTPDNRGQVVNGQTNNEQLQKAVEYYHKFGDSAPLRREWFSGMTLHPEMPKGN